MDQTMNHRQSSSIYLSDLANEILIHIFHSLSSIPDCLALAATNGHFRSLLASSHRLPILYDAAEAQYGPLGDAIRLVTHNTSQAPHIPRPLPPQSFALLQQIIEAGRVANKWADIYPCQKWRGEDSVCRRFLSDAERYKLRRACYRMWIYTLAFHNPANPRSSRSFPPVLRTRAALLRPWSGDQLAEIIDLQGIFRQVLQTVICPSNSAVIRHHKARHPNDPFPLFALTQPEKWAREHALFQHRTHFHCTPHVSNLLTPDKLVNGYGVAIEGWGDEISHYYVVEDMLKLDPGQMIYLHEQITETLGAAAAFNAGWSSKGLVESFVAGLGGEWFENNGETMAETVGYVVGERGGDGLELRAGVEDGLCGIVRTEWDSE